MMITMSGSAQMPGTYINITVPTHLAHTCRAFTQNIDLISQLNFRHYNGSLGLHTFYANRHFAEFAMVCVLIFQFYL